MSDPDLETDDSLGVGEAGFLTINLQAAEDAAKLYDFSGRDFVINLDIDLGGIKPINFVTIDPVLFSSANFIKVLDVATSIEDEGGFTTVDGFEEQMFDKVLTPEANKELQVEGVSNELGPVNFNVQGLGVFAFPLREASKIRMTLLMEEPTANQYERLHVLVQNITAVTTTTSSKKKKWICWVAREVYGANDPRWIAFREWLITEAPLWLVKLYTRYGETVARFIQNKPMIKYIIKSWMNRRLKKHG
jgi:hypothetical protein